MLRVILYGIDAKKVVFGVRVFPDHLHMVTALRHAILPRRLKLALGTLHGKDRDLIEPPVNPHFNLGDVRVGRLCETEDLRAQVLLCDTRCIIGTDAAQAHEVAPDYEAVALEVEFIDGIHPFVLLVAVNRVCIYEILLERQGFYRLLRNDYLRFTKLPAVLFY